MAPVRRVPRVVHIPRRPGRPDGPAPPPARRAYGPPSGAGPPLRAPFNSAAKQTMTEILNGMVHELAAEDFVVALASAQAQRIAEPDVEVPVPPGRCRAPCRGEMARSRPRWNEGERSPSSRRT